MASRIIKKKSFKLRCIPKRILYGVAAKAIGARKEILKGVMVIDIKLYEPSPR
jgi:hypothetical protein